MKTELKMMSYLADLVVAVRAQGLLVLRCLVQHQIFRRAQVLIMDLHLCIQQALKRVPVKLGLKWDAREHIQQLLMISGMY
jgi:hypothetical protein